jgi:hypothetical protein
MSELTIPEEAMPVVEILRRDVVRPTAELVIDTEEYAPRFVCGKCPMGLHLTARSLTPFSHDHFSEDGPVWNDVIIDGFWQWWDGLTLEQATAALDLIWPQEQSK